MTPLRSLIVFAGVSLFSRTFAYVDFGSLTLPVEPLFEPTPRPEQLPEDYDLRYEILPSMITAVAPSVTLVGNGTHETLYSLHYHHYFSKTRQGRGKFNKRGVFSGDPPVATCNPCGSDGTYTPGTTTTTNSMPCTTHTYHGVFDFPPSSTAASCSNTNYGSVLQPSSFSYAGLPCCFTIPASCRLNSTLLANTTTSFAASTGVFRPTSTSTTTRLTITSTSSRFSLSTPTSTSSSSQSQGPILNSGSTSASTSASATTSSSSSRSQSLGPILNTGTTSTFASGSSSRSRSQSFGPTINSVTTSTPISSSARTTVTVISGTTTILTLTTSSKTATRGGSSSGLVSSNPYTTPSPSILITTTSYSIIVISSTTFTLAPSSMTASTSGGGGISVQPTLTVITGSTTSFASTSISLITSIASNTIIGCGVASGSGIIEGTGTVYLAATSVIAIGTVSGYASHVSGCGTIIATTGSFSGTASITGCGFGYGTGALTGMGTVWPWYGGGLLSFVSSGTVSGAGSFVGCGTITGSGTFSATNGSPVLITPTSRPTRTVSVYISYCPDPTTDATSLFRLSSASNTTLNTSPANLNLNATSPLGYTSPYADTADDPPSSNSTLPNPLCQVCPNSVGVCCPPTVSCDVSDGKCPIFALENAGNTINGYLIQQVMNSTAPVAGRKKVRALAKKNVDEVPRGRDLVRSEKKHKEKHGRAHHKHF